MPVTEAATRPTLRTEITAEDMSDALKLLSQGKAASFDQLSDKVLKAALLRSEPLREKTRKMFNEWLNGVSSMPWYLMRARTVLLSKDEGN